MNRPSVLKEYDFGSGIDPGAGNQKRRLGQFGESFAVMYLCGSLGWTLIDTNWRCRVGELDIIACDGHEIVFVEVRTRRAVRGSVLEAVGPTKLRQLKRVLPYALKAYRPVAGARLDVVLVGVMGWTVCELHHFRAVQL